MGMFEQLPGNQAFLAGEALSLADLHRVPIFGYFVATPESAPIREDKPGLHRRWEAAKARERMAKTEPKLG